MLQMSHTKLPQHLTDAEGTTTRTVNFTTKLLRTMRDVTTLLLQHRLLRDGHKVVDHSTLENEATMFL